jgi:oxygen-independent coproporphyrinogen-3 oxidase
MPLDDATLAVDALVFGLRMNAGVDVGALRARFPAFQWDAAEAVLRELCDEDLSEADGSRVRLTRRGRLLADRVGVHLMERLDGDPGEAAAALGAIPRA